MSWTVTIEVVDCASPSSTLSGAKIEMGVVELGLTDASGLLDATFDDFNVSPVIKISKTDFIAKNFALDKATQSDTTQTVCLENPPTFPDGGDIDEPGKAGGQSFGGGGCFIVTATTGSSESVEVNRLRGLRDRISGASRLAGELIDVIYGEYKQFSPGIAAELRQDEIARQAVLQMVVRPLFAWYTLAGILAFEGGDRSAVSEASQDVRSACPRYLGGFILPVLEAMCEGRELPKSTPPVLLDLAPQVAQLPFASWAILDPLVRVWRSGSDHLDVVDEVAQWLASAPLEAVSPPSDPEQLDVELGVLADFLDFRPGVRPRLGERLRAAWPDTAVALEHAGFVS